MEGYDIKKLREACTSEIQRQTLDAVIEHGSNNKAAKALGKARRTVDITMKRIKRNANEQFKEGYIVKGESVLYGPDGETKLRWVKTTQDQQSQQEMMECIEAVFEEYKGKSELITTPRSTDRETITVYPWGDPHIGLYSHAAETGANFDCEIAEQNLTRTMSELVSLVPASDTAIILNLGDFFHADDQSNKTSRSGHALDVDGRWHKVYRIGVNLMIKCIDYALQKHKKVVVRNVLGNHDDHTSQTLTVALACFYANNPRVEVVESPAMYWYYDFDRCLFGATHGHGAKPKDLPLLMANDCPEGWAGSDFRFWHFGHIHHDTKEDHVGCVVESHRTLAAPDAWTAERGYRSQRDMKALTYHGKYGEEIRNTRNIRRIVS